MDIIITAYRGEGTYLLKELKKLGEFKKTIFRDVIIGKVKDMDDFFNKLSQEPPLSLARAIPLNKVFYFSNPEELMDKLKEEINKISLKKEKSFKVIVERRGWKGIINSNELEKIFGELLYKKTKNPVDLTNPQQKVVIEILDKLCGISLISKEMQEKYFFIKIK